MGAEGNSVESGYKASSPDLWWRWIWVVLFSIAFAWVESSVVVYLREIYFDGSFSFPIVVNWVDGKHVIDHLVRIELGREVATILMLVAVGCTAGKNPLQKFCFFMIAFGVWDVFYYVWLWVMTRWPEGVMTWDLLFFIPLPWVGPVLTPILIAVAMVTAGFLIIYYDEKITFIKFYWYDWVVELGCGVMMIVAFCWDWKNILRVPDGVMRSGLPNPFAWWLYLPAYIFSVAYFAIRLKQIVSKRKQRLSTETELL